MSWINAFELMCYIIVGIMLVDLRVASIIRTSFFTGGFPPILR